MTLDEWPKSSPIAGRERSEEGQGRGEQEREPERERERGEGEGASLCSLPSNPFLRGISQRPRRLLGLPRRLVKRRATPTRTPTRKPSTPTPKGGKTSAKKSADSRLRASLQLKANAAAISPPSLPVGDGSRAHPVHN